MIEIASPQKAIRLLTCHFGASPAPSVISVPGRVNLIGEHIDYHSLPVLPMAIQRRLTIAFRARDDSRVRAITDQQYDLREFRLTDHLEASPPGDWANYLKAGAKAVQARWNLTRGIEAAIVSDLPAAAGLSSSSALLTGIAIALLQANGVQPQVSELMDVLPEGEYFVGTRGGAMDHAAVLASRAGCVLRVDFAPLEFTPIPIPSDWSFVVAHSLTRAEKSGAVRTEYNARKAAGNRALEQLGLPCYRAALAAGISNVNGDPELGAFRHVTSEALRVEEAVVALRGADFVKFGHLLNASHASLRDQLRVSTREIDLLVETALQAGAEGARLTGAGFGGCIIALCRATQRDAVCEQLIRRFYASRPHFDPENDLFVAQPSAGALVD